MELILFYVFAVTVVGGGIGVVASRNPVASLMFMVVSLASVAGIYVLLEAHFLAAIQVMVYAGAIMVLFLFVIMLLNLGHDYRDDLVRGLYAVCAFVASGAICGICWRPGSAARRRARCTRAFPAPRRWTWSWPSGARCR